MHWTHVGEWAKLPTNRDEKLQEGDENYEIVRIESYIDEEGVIKKGVCYTKVATDMDVWFRHEEIMESHPHW